MSDARRVSNPRGVEEDGSTSVAPTMWFDSPNGTHALVPWEMWRDYLQLDDLAVQRRDESGRLREALREIVEIYGNSTARSVARRALAETEADDAEVQDE